MPHENESNENDDDDWSRGKHDWDHVYEYEMAWMSLQQLHSPGSTDPL